MTCKKIVAYRDGVIELYAYDLSVDENKELREEIEKYFSTVEYSYIDPDSFRCEISNATYGGLKRLEEELGWSF